MRPPFVWPGVLTLIGVKVIVQPIEIGRMKPRRAWLRGKARRFPPLLFLRRRRSSFLFQLILKLKAESQMNRRSPVECPSVSDAAFKSSH